MTLRTMPLREYLSAPGALTAEELCQRIGAKSAAQIRQWRTGTNGRQPSPSYAVAIERATDGRVPRWESRPNDWFQIWPELIGTEGVPAIPTEAKAA